MADWRTRMAESQQAAQAATRTLSKAMMEQGMAVTDAVRSGAVAQEKLAQAGQRLAVASRRLAAPRRIELDSNGMPRRVAPEEMQ